MASRAAGLPRALVPFGARKLTGVVLALHDTPPDGTAKEVLRLLDEEPVLDAELLALGRWIAITTARRWAKCCAA